MIGRLGLPVVLSALLAACAALSPTPAARPSVLGAQQQRPNIIFIIADDLGYGDVGFNGSETIRTPNIDALAASGVTLTAGYVTAAVCAPSRAAIFTGRHQQRFGYEFNPRGRDRQGVGIPEGVPTAPGMMRAAGYHTGLVGKWHLGSTREVHPLNRGFDEFFGFVAGGNSYLARLEPGDLAFDDPVEGSAPGFRPMRLERGFDEVPAEGYLTERLSEEAVAFIGRNRERPFFLTLTQFAPHSPLQAPRRYLDRYANIEDEQTRTYAAMVSALDDSVGQIVAAVEAAGLRDNTIIVFMSDNGCAAYIGPGRCSNRPLQGFKGTYLEGGVRVPMAISWPGVLAAGGRYDHPVTSMDITATALSSAGIDWRAADLDGVDLLPFLTGANEAPPHERLVWRTAPNYAIRQGNWKMWVLQRHDGQGFETLLYDLAADPGETRNLAAANPEVVARLNAVFAEWSSTIEPPSFNSQRTSTITLSDGVEVNIFN